MRAQRFGGRKRREFLNQRGEYCDSEFEVRVTNDLIARGVEYLWQPGPYVYHTPVRGGFCQECGGSRTQQSRLYTPDIRLPTGRFVEVKGYLDAKTRNLMATFAAQHPQMMLSFVFMTNRKLPLKRTPRYLDWGQKHGAAAAVGRIPENWYE